MSILSEIIADANPWHHWPDSIPSASQLPRRAAFQTLRTRLIDPSDRRAQVLRGPRQVGKTTLLLQLIAELLREGVDARRVLFFDFSVARLRGTPSRWDLLAATAGGPDSMFCFFVEISRAATWNQWLKQAVDKGQHRFVVTDSSAALLRAGGRESGLGRWDETLLEPLTYVEWLHLQGGAHEDVESILARLPGAFYRYLANSGWPEFRLTSAVNVRQRLRADIADRAIHRDLAHRGLDLDRVLQLFSYFAQKSGRSTSIANLARSVEPSTDQATVRRWLEALTDSALLWQLRNVGSNSLRAAFSDAKTYVCDPGIIVAFSPLSEPLHDPETKGAAFEAVAYRQLRELQREHGGELGFFRAGKSAANGKSAAKEIDFVYITQGHRIAIEVKSGTPSDKDIKKFMTATDLFGATRRFVLHGGGLDRSLRASGVQVLPMQSFLLDPDLVLRS